MKNGKSVSALDESRHHHRYLSSWNHLPSRVETIPFRRAGSAEISPQGPISSTRLKVFPPNRCAIRLSGVARNGVHVTCGAGLARRWSPTVSAWGFITLKEKCMSKIHIHIHVKIKDWWRTNYRRRNVKWSESSDFLHNKKKKIMNTWNKYIFYYYMLE